MLSDERLEEIRRRCQAATPGPWVDLADIYWERMQAHRQATGRWWHGELRDSKPMTLIACANVRGEPVSPADIPKRVDWHDLQKIIGLRWIDFGDKVTEAVAPLPNAADLAFIAASRQDAEDLLAEVDRLRAELAQRPTRDQ